MQQDLLAGAGAFFHRILERHAVVNLPLSALIFVLLGAVLTNNRAYWYLKYPVTLVHEAGHGFVAMLSGRKLSGIRLHSDTSGLTTSAGKRRGLGAVLTSAAGYPAPTVLELVIVYLISLGYATASLWALLAMLVLVLLQIRNWFGVWSVLASGAVVVLAAQFLTPFFQGLIATAIAALLLLGAVRSVRNLQMARRAEMRLSGKSVSDADGLREETGLPAALWVGFFYLFTCAGVGATVVFLVLSAQR